MKAAGVNSLESAQIWFGAGDSCGLCRPYIARMIATGETSFDVLDPSFPSEIVR